MTQIGAAKPGAATGPRVNSPGQVLFASLIGTTIEFFDFYIYATAAVLVASGAAAKTAAGERGLGTVAEPRPRANARTRSAASPRGSTRSSCSAWSATS